MTISKNIKDIANSKRILFTTPSHDRTAFVPPECNEITGRKFFYHDLSEINGLDNLSDPNNSILQSMEKTAELIGVEKVFYLTNGSTSGIIAAMTAVLNENDKVLIARNCHKSVINGLILSGANPVWLVPEINEEWNIFTPVTAKAVQAKLMQNNDIKAVIITSLTYEGVNSDITEIARICHEYNKILIVDEAHGALKSFSPQHFGENAVKLGADICVQSLHKTCGAPNPCAILLCGQNINSSAIQNSLNLINTTSPSFPLLASIEATVNYLFSKDGQKQIDNLVKNINELKKAFEGNLKIEFCNFNDISKILVKIKGLSGFDLSDILFEEFNIEDELTNNKASLLLTGIGTTKHKLKILEKALKTILSTEYFDVKRASKCPIIVPDMIMTPRTAFFKEKAEINTPDACGKICAEIISEYPPGIPILLPGERISQHHIDYLQRINKMKIITVK